MKYKVFRLSPNDTSSEEMNAFISSHKVLDIEKHHFVDETGDHWSFCLGYLDSNVSSKGVYNQNSEPKKAKVDYRDVLDDVTFTKFSKLREARKIIAEQEGVPAYAIFTNEELAGVAKLSSLTESELKKVSGIGDKKAEKYAERIKLLYDQM